MLCPTVQRASGSGTHKQGNSCSSHLPFAPWACVDFSDKWSIKGGWPANIESFIRTRLCSAQDTERRVGIVANSLLCAGIHSGSDVLFHALRGFEPHFVVLEPFESVKKQVEFLLKCKSPMWRDCDKAGVTRAAALEPLFEQFPVVRVSLGGWHAFAVFRVSMGLV